MKGLTLAQSFYEQCAKPLFEKEYPEVLESVAIGLVGEGSECFGFDDGQSQDHDFGARFCLWLPEEEWAIHLDGVERVLAGLQEEFQGFQVLMLPEKRMGRSGPMSTEHFYARFLGRPTVPQSWQEWRTIPEHFLAVATNGAVFHDPSARFSTIRQTLLQGYPEDVRLKKMAARCATMAQSGQYNVARCLQRNEYAGAMLALARFSEATISLTFLLNKRYVPFYKWAHHASQFLPILGQETHVCIQKLSAISMNEAAMNLGQGGSKDVMETMESLCVAIGEYLRATGLSESHDDWMMSHAEAIQSRIQTPALLRMPVLLE